MTRTGRPLKAQGPIGELARSLGPGGLEKLAKAIGSSVRTLRRAASEGTIPTGDAGIRIYGLCKQAGIPVPEPERTIPIWRRP